MTSGRRLILLFCLASLLCGAAMAAGWFDRWGRRWAHVAIAGGQVLLTVAYVATGDPAADIRLFYVWASPYAAVFFGRRTAMAHCLWSIALLGGALLMIRPPPADGLSVWLSTAALVAATGVLVGWAAGLDRRRRLELRRLAERDELTGLPNRRLFSRLLARTLADPASTAVLLMIDLDSFRTVNDCHGHGVGDELLRQMAPRLAARLAPGDVLGRLGGDEFAVLHPVPTGGRSVAAAAREAQRSGMTLAGRLALAWDEPFALGDGAGRVHSSGCVGVAVAEGQHVTPTCLLRAADAALYRAKGAGRGQVGLYDAGLRRAATRRLALENALRGAAGRGELSIACQPIVALCGGRVVGAEALCRWRSPTLGPVSPEEFVPVAEDSGLIDEVAGFVLASAVGLLSRWEQAGLLGDDVTLAVNVSPLQVRAGLAEQLARAVGTAGVAPQRLALELTERVLMDHSLTTACELAEIRGAGHPLLLDDFGTGYSALSYLADLPVDSVKIDRSFVAALATDPRREAVVGAVLSMADALGLGAVAEGVETSAQAERLVALGCRTAQGRYFAAPVPAARLEALLRLESRARPAAVPGRLPVRR